MMDQNICRPVFNQNKKVANLIQVGVLPSLRKSRLFEGLSPVLFSEVSEKQIKTVLANSVHLRRLRY